MTAHADTPIFEYIVRYLVRYLVKYTVSEAAFLVSSISTVSTLQWDLCDVTIYN